MRLVDRPLAATALLELEPRHDARGCFSRLFCRTTLAELGFSVDIVQANLSFSARPHTLRGLHLQVGMAAETKLVHCVAGAVFDVVADVRSGSPTQGQWRGFELSAANRRMAVVPPGFAHGFLTLAAETQVVYLVSAAHSPTHERGVAFDDPAFAIEWPHRPAVISPRDRAHPPFDPRRLWAAG